jgi:hypothetical protein
MLHKDCLFVGPAGAEPTTASSATKPMRTIRASLPLQPNKPFNNESSRTVSRIPSPNERGNMHEFVSPVQNEQHPNQDSNAIADKVWAQVVI